MSELETLIRGYYADSNISAIISLAESLKDARDRAELKTQAYLHEIKELAQRFANITEPASGRKVSDREPREPRMSTTNSNSSNQSKPKVSKSKPDLSVDIEL